MTQNQLSTDLALCTACAAGDPAASEALVRQYSNLVYGSIQHALRLKQVVCSREDMEDLHNTVFLQLFDDGCRRLRRYRGKNGCSLASWIRLIAVRTVLNHLRSRSPHSLGTKRQLVGLDDIAELRDPGGTAWKALEESEQHRLVDEAVQTLPVRERLFFRLHFEKGLGLTQVAETLQITVQNAYTIKHRTVKRLKAKVEAMSQS